jgi:hypothetical protein
MKLVTSRLRCYYSPNKLGANNNNNNNNNKNKPPLTSSSSIYYSQLAMAWIHNAAAASLA